MFQFKQFAVDQSGCAMKINTDGVLLGAIATANNPAKILDIGTGTGVIAMMLAQRFERSIIDAVEIDVIAAATAKRNFEASKFNNRLACYAKGFADFFTDHLQNKYDLIVSNPPFYIDSLKSPDTLRTTAKHTDEHFFETLVYNAAQHLTAEGLMWFILPVSISVPIQAIALKHGLYTHQIIEVSSYPHDDPHRHIIAFSFTESYLSQNNLVIYQSPKVYTEQYKNLLKTFFTIF